MRDNASKNKSKDIKEFLELVGVQNHFSTAHEHMQKGPAKSTINSIMLLARTIMVESGLGGRFWFKAATAGKDAKLGNAVYSLILIPVILFYNPQTRSHKSRSAAALRPHPIWQCTKNLKKYLDLGLSDARPMFI